MTYNKRYIILLVLVLLVGCNSSPPTGAVASGPAQGDAVRTEAGPGQVFSPATLELPAGEEVTIEVVNVDGQAHDFAVEAADLNTGTLEPGAVATATLVVPAGTTSFVCTFHSDMRGTIEGR